MVSANNITVSYAKALLMAAPTEMLIDGKKPQKLTGVTQEQTSRENCANVITSVEKYEIDEATEFGRDGISDEGREAIPKDSLPGGDGNGR